MFVLQVVCLSVVRLNDEQHLYWLVFIMSLLALEQVWREQRDAYY